MNLAILSLSAVIIGYMVLKRCNDERDYWSIVIDNFFNIWGIQCQQGIPGENDFLLITY